MSPPGPGRQLRAAQGSSGAAGGGVMGGGAMPGHLWSTATAGLCETLGAGPGEETPPVSRHHPAAAAPLAGSTLGDHHKEINAARACDQDTSCCLVSSLILLSPIYFNPDTPHWITSLDPTRAICPTMMTVTLPPSVCASNLTRLDRRPIISFL